MKQATDYQNKVLTWAAGRKFLYLSGVTIHENRPPCDACGSKLVRNFKLVEHLDNHYLIGSDCFDLLYALDRIITDARMQWKGTPFWRDLTAIEDKVIAEKHLIPNCRRGN